LRPFLGLCTLLNSSYRFSLLSPTHVLFPEKKEKK
jgi:hypothetical protein